MRIFKIPGVLTGLATFLAPAFMAVQPTLSQAQELVLEEVVVTAQRRVQSLQDVPISINVYSGEDISIQGYRQLEDLARFSPSVNIREGNEDSVIKIRGFGSEGNSITLQSATPIFLDGVAFGRRSMVNNAFLDVERVEVLKGPQPLFFGMNAVGGAFNVQSRRPTPEWQGDISAEFGTDDHKELSIGVGGPITNSLGIRLAAITESSDGALKNRITHDKYPRYSNLGGRISLLWSPNDQLDVLTKFEISKLRKGGDAIVGCLTGGALSGYNGDSPLDGGVDESLEGQFGNVNSVWAVPPLGVGGLGDAKLPEQRGSDCFSAAEYGFSFEGPYIEPVRGVHNDQGDMGEGLIDFREAGEGFALQDGPGGPGPLGADSGGIDGKDNIDSWNALLDVTYRLDNGISINSQTAMVRYYRIAVWDNRDSPFATNFAIRNEDYYQYSQQFRVESPAEGWDLNVGFPGGLNVTAMAGVFAQTSSLDSFLNIMRATTRRGNRFNKVWEDARWLSGFWNVDLHFMDGQLTLSGGGRYTDIHKDAFVRGHGSQWIWDEIPCDSDGADDNPASCTPDPDFKRVDPSLNTFTHIDPITGNGGGGDADELVRIDSPLITVDESQVDSDNLWTVAYFNDTRAAPLNYRGGGADAVGMTAPVFSNRMGPHGPCAGCILDIDQDENVYDNQVVLSYSPNALGGRHTFYAKYATAFKGPVTDTGRGGIPEDVGELIAEAEFGDGYEAGAKGTFLNRRLRYDVAVFKNTFDDLQAIATFPVFNPLDQTSFSTNVDQKVQGLEFSVTALATENLTVNLAGALMDGEVTDFNTGGCSNDQILIAAADAVRNPQGRSADEITEANDLLDEIGPTRRARALSLPIPEDGLGCRLVDEELADGSVIPALTIDRSGIQPSRTPDWKFVLGLDYTRPVSDTFQIHLNAKGFISDGYSTDPETYDRKIGFDRHGDINLSGGFGPQDGTWKVTGYVRNLLEAAETFRNEYNFEQPGWHVAEIADQFMSYGVRFDYYYR